MAKMEAIKEMEEEEEEDDEYGGKKKEVLKQVSHKVNEEVTLYQPELCIIYSCLHSAWKTEDTRWNAAEIKQIVGHAMLELDDVKYGHLDLGDVIERLRNKNDALTRGGKVPAEKLKDNWVNWIPQRYAKYLKMCRKDKMLAPSRLFGDTVSTNWTCRLAQQRDEELRAQRIAQTIASRIQDEEHKVSQSYPSITAVLGESSSESRGDERQEGYHGER